MPDAVPSACSSSTGRCRRRRRGRRRSGRRTGRAARPRAARASSSRSRPMTRACRAALEDRLRVPAHAERAVDADRPRLGERGLEEVDDAVAQHGDVPLGGVSSAAHRDPSGRCWCSVRGRCGVWLGGRWCDGAVPGWGVVVQVDPATGPHPIRARRGGSRVGRRVGWRPAVGSSGAGRSWVVGRRRGGLRRRHVRAYRPGTTSSDGTE